MDKIRKEKIEKIAYSIYLKYKDRNNPTRDWAEAESIYDSKVKYFLWKLKQLEVMTIIRYRYGAYSFIISAVLLGLFLWFKRPTIFTRHMEILWCLGWAAFGVGCGLINSRYDDINKKKKEDKDIKKNKGGHMHYILYFSFVGFIATLAALTMIKNGYTASALTGIVIGFTGDKLVEKMLELKS